MLRLAALLCSGLSAAAADTLDGRGRCVCTGDRAADPRCCWHGHAFVPQQPRLEQTPLRGWRSWQAYSTEINQAIMEDTMRGLAKKRQLGGSFSSLAAAGYADVGLDAGYGMVGHGFGGSCHTESGHMLVNASRFPSFNQMTDTAHALGLTASWYLNYDGCKGSNETRSGAPWASGCNGVPWENNCTGTYDTDSADAVKYGFDGVKFDLQGGGPSHNITRWAMALAKASAAAGKKVGMLVEVRLPPPPPPPPLRVPGAAGVVGGADGARIRPPFSTELR